MRNDFGLLCKYWKLSPKTVEGRAQAFSYLSRLVVERFDREAAAQRELEGLARRYVEGNPAEVVRVLNAFLEIRLGNETFPDQVRAELIRNGLEPFAVASDDRRIAETFSTLRERFRRSLSPLLIDGRLMSRPETAVLLRTLLDDAGASRVAFVHGVAGTGKSGVLYELTERLEERQVPHVALRLDRWQLAGGALQFARATWGLPATLARCLATFAGSRPAVLILDQLDALRWTAAHASDAWDVCTEIIEDALTFPNLRVVVACRTFDMQDDFRISNLRHELKANVVSVGALLEETVRGVIERRGVAWNRITPRQRTLLTNPNALHQWLVVQSGRPSAADVLDHPTALMRAFWRARREQLIAMGVSADELERTLETLVDYMDRERVLSAPVTLIERYPAPLKALQSVDVLLQDGERVVLSHQSYLDHLVAERTLRAALDRRATLVEWVLSHEQSLFRRAQLQHALALLRDADPRVYIDSVRELLTRSGVRFHLRTLALRVLAAASPTEAEVSLVLELARNDRWFLQIGDHVLLRNVAWVRALHERDVLHAWLQDATRQEPTVRFLRTTYEHVTDIVEELAGRVDLNDAGWQSVFLNVLWFDPAKDSEATFALRVRLVSQLRFVPFASWDDLARTHPARTLRLYEVVLTSILDDPERFLEGAPTHREMPLDDPRPLAIVARSLPAEAIATGYPLAIRARQQLAQERNQQDDQDGNCDRRIDLLDDVERCLLRMLGTAAANLARTQPRCFLDFVANTQGENDELVIAQGFAAGDVSIANEAMAWLQGRPGRLRLERPHAHGRAGRWLARTILARLSPHCSQEVFQATERLVLQERDPNAAELYRLHREFNEDLSRDRLGLLQFLLLSVLDPRRRSAEARRRLLALGPKFEGVDFAERGSMELTRVDSPIPPERLTRVPDSEWRSIVHDPDIPPERTRPARRVGGRLVDGSVVAYARDLRAVAHREPGRFARLARLFEPQVPTQYLAAILGGLGRRSPPDDLREEQEREAWEPATHAELEAVLVRVGYSEDHDLGAAFCDVLSAFPQHDWSATVRDALRQYAAHAHPTRDSDNERVLYAGGVRGQVAQAIQGMLAHHPARFDEFSDAIAALVRDSIGAVRREAIGACARVLPINAALAIQWVTTACDHPSGQVLRGDPWLNEFVARALPAHAGAVEPILRRQVYSTDYEVAECGAEWVTSLWFRHSLCESLAASCRRGTVPQRKGVASAVARLVARQPNTDAEAWLSDCLGDADEEVRSEATTVFRVPGALAQPHMPALLQRFVESPAFQNTEHHLVGELADYSGPTRAYREVIFVAASVFAGPLAASTRDVSRAVGGEVRSLMSLLLRVYEESQDERDVPTQVRCLEAFDALLEARVGFAPDVISELDAG